METPIRILLILVAVAGVVHGQGHLDFSGTWVVVPERSVWYDNGRPIDVTVFGERFTAEQTGQILSVAIDNERGFKWRYRLDGVPSRNAPLGPNGPQETSSITAWTGSTLIIKTTGATNHLGRVEGIETRRGLRLNEDGTLRVEAPWGVNGAMIGSVYSRER